MSGYVDLTQLDHDELRKLYKKMGAGVKPPSRRPTPTARRTVSSDRFRLIRGQSVGAQSGSTILIDNVLVLAGGMDPSSGNAATQIEVANLFGQSFSDNEAVQAIFSIDASAGVDWETIKTSSGTETYRLIRAQVKGNPAPEDTTFTVDNVIPLAGGLDPVSGNPATEIVVFKNPRGTWHEDLYDNEEVTCAYQPGASVSPAADWILLPVERRRSIRGKAYTAYLTSATTIEIDGIHALESGLDPRTDPTDATERVEVSNTAFSQAFADNEDVYADWNCKAGVWEARKKIPGDAGASGTYVCVLSGNLAAGSIATPATGTATVYSISGPGGTTTSLGTRTVISHRDYILYASGNAYYCQLTYAAEDPADSEFTVISDHIPAWLNSQAGYSLGGVQVFTHGTDAGFDWLTLACQEVVTAVACVDGEVTGTTATYYVIACTP